MKKISQILISLLVLFPLLMFGAEAAEQKSTFIYVSGDKILDQDGKDFYIKGISFGNSVWGEPTAPSKTHHTEKSYKEIAALGFNSVRFYLNYNLFEDDNNPYNYKKSGFDWIDRNVKWAKKYNIKLILNMHVPQGGFQSQGNGMALWTEESNQERLSALWQAIAEKYADEPTIIGYGLVNEPCIPLEGTVRQSINQYKTFIENLVKEIREKDKNHILFIEKLLAVKNLETGENVYGEEGEYEHFLVADKNTVYEFHDYTPFLFTHQNTEWAGTKGVIKFYPSEEIISYEGDNAWLGCETARKTEKERNGWVYYESRPVAKSNEYNLGKISCQVFNSGRDGTVYFDEIKITQYDKTGKKLEIIIVNPNEKSDFWFWSNNGSGSYGKANAVGYNDKNSLYIKGATNDSNFSGKFFELKEGYKYVVSAWVKRENCNTNVITAPRIDFVKGSNIQQANKEYLESNLLKSIKFGDENNVPMYLGEFGVVTEAFTQNRGALQWVSDMVSICEKYGIHFNYHTYHEVSFGLYMNSDYELPNKLNTKLAKLFKKILK